MDEYDKEYRDIYNPSPEEVICLQDEGWRLINIKDGKWTFELWNLKDLPQTEAAR